jgi:hypothetical protein
MTNFIGYNMVFASKKYQNNTKWAIKRELYSPFHGSRVNLMRARPLFWIVDHPHKTTPTDVISSVGKK